MTHFLLTYAGPLVFFTVVALFALCMIPSIVARTKPSQPRIPAPRRAVSSNRKAGRL